MQMYELEKELAVQRADFLNGKAQAALDAYNKRCEQYKEDQAAFISDCRMSGMSEIDAFAAALRAGYGPRVYNPPTHAMVKYIVS